MKRNDVHWFYISAASLCVKVIVEKGSGGFYNSKEIVLKESSVFWTRIQMLLVANRL